MWLLPKVEINGVQLLANTGMASETCGDGNPATFVQRTTQFIDGNARPIGNLVLSFSVVGVVGMATVAWRQEKDVDETWVKIVKTGRREREEKKIPGHQETCSRHLLDQNSLVKIFLPLNLHVRNPKRICSSRIEK